MSDDTGVRRVSGAVGRTGVLPRERVGVPVEGVVVVEVEAEPEPDPLAGTDEPCLVLAEEVAYVRGWMEAAGAVAVLRDELTACGLDTRIPLRAEVTVAGIGVVEFGRVTPATVRRLAALLALARTEATGPGQATESSEATRGGGGRDQAA